MIYSDKVRGTEVYNFLGKKVGVVLYPVWKLKNKNVDGFVLIKNSFLQIKFFLPFSSVDRFEKDCIYLIKSYKTRRQVEEIHHGKVVISGETAFLSNYGFDGKKGCVKFVEIAKSIYEDIHYKRKRYYKFSVKNGLIIIE